MNDIVFFDTEATGVEAGSHITEIAAIRTTAAGDEIDRKSWFVDPFMPLPPDAQAVNHITVEKLMDAPGAAEALPEFLAFCEGAGLGIAQFASYDVGILSYWLEAMQLPMPSFPVLCTCEMAKSLKETTNNKLATLVAHYGIKLCGDPHRAMTDADACRQYYQLAKGKPHSAQPRPWAPEYRWCEPNALPAHLLRLPKAVQDGAPFSFAYEDAKGNRTSRTITPYGWALTDKGVSFHGLCHEKQERRTFLADRVVVG